MRKVTVIGAIIMFSVHPDVSMADGITSAVPEPSVLLYLGFSLVVLGLFLYRKGRKKKQD